MKLTDGIVAILKALNSPNWPAVVLVLGIIAIFLFRKPIAGLIGRIRSAGKWFTADAPPEAQQDTRRQSDVVEKLKDVSSPVIRDRENRIKMDLESSGLETSGDTVSILTRRLAAAQFLVFAERIYNNIFGGQIYILKRINESKLTGLQKNIVDGHFIHVSTVLFPEHLKGWTLQTYMDFLVSNGLVVEREDRYYITGDGAEFLVWMAHMGRAENRGCKEPKRHRRIRCRQDRARAFKPWTSVFISGSIERLIW